MKILFSLTYYLPYISGLSIYAQRVAEGLNKKGFKTNIVTSQFDRALPKKEITKGVEITRVPYQLKISKGLIMLGWFKQCYSSVKESEVVFCHFPQVEGFWLVLFAKLLKKKSIIVYQCDVVLPRGFPNNLIERFLAITNLISCALADIVVSSSYDYAKHSWILSKFLKKVRVIYPPIKDFSLVKGKDEIVAEKMGGYGCKIGFVGRLSADKGIEYLLKSIPFLEKSLKYFKIYLVGPKDAIGEEKYVKKIERLLEDNKDKVELLGKLPEESLAYFYKNIDVLVLPSINSTEAFGMVQVEAMLCGVPVAVSNLPGVREVVSKTNMGEKFSVGDSEEIAKTICRIVNKRSYYKRKRNIVQKMFSIDKTLSDYENIILKPL